MPLAVVRGGATRASQGGYPSAAARRRMGTGVNPGKAADGSGFPRTKNSETFFSPRTGREEDPAPSHPTARQALGTAQTSPPAAFGSRRATDMTTRCWRFRPGYAPA